MTQINGWAAGIDENWKVRALNILWLEAHRPMHTINLRGRSVEAEGLLVYDVSSCLRKVNVDWLRYATPETKNMQDWLTHHFPVCMQQRRVGGENCTAVVFQYVSKTDFAACALQEKIPSLPEDQRGYDDVVRMMRQEYGLDETSVESAFAKYPKSLQRTEEGCACLSNKVVVEMPEEIGECAFAAVKGLIEASPDRSVMATKVPTTIPWLKNYYAKGSLGTWLTERFEELRIEEKPDNPLVKIVKLKENDDQPVETDWKERALSLLWDEAHLPLHPITMRGKTVEIEGANVYDVSELLRKNRIEWSAYRTAETANIISWLTKNFPVCLQAKRVEGMEYTAIFFQYVSKVDYAACAMYDRLRQSPEPYDQLIREMRISCGIGADTAAEAFDMYPQSLLRDGQLCRATAVKVVVDMPKSIQSCTYDVLKKAIDADPEYCLLMSRVPQIAPWIRHYYTSLGSWMSSNFSFRIEPKSEDNTIEVLRYASDMKDWCRNVIRDQLLKFRGQSARIDELDALARNARCDLSILKGQRPQQEWLDELLQGGDIRLTEDGENVYVPLPEGQLNFMPVRPHEECEEELLQAQSVCYFAWEQLRQMAYLTCGSGQELIKAPWMRYFSHVLAQALSGVEGEMIFDAQGEQGRAVLPLRLATEDGAQLYAVLEKNPTPQKQPLKLAAIVYPGQEHEDGCGRYLCERFGLAAGNAAQSAYDSLKETVDQLQMLQARLENSLAEAGRAVAAGVADLPEGFLEDIELWRKRWAEADEIIVSLGWKYDMPHPSIEAIRDRVMDSSAESQMMDEAIGRFDGMVSRIDRFMEETPPFNGAAYAPCRRQMEEDRKSVALSSVKSIQDCEAFGRMLESYRALRAIAGAAALTEDLPQHQMVVSAHFGVPFFMTSQFMGTASRQFMSEPPLGCLDELDELGNMLSEIGVSIRSRSAAVPKGRNAVSAEELLARLMEAGSGAGLFETVSVYPEDELEALLVRAEFDQARQLILSGTDDNSQRAKMVSGLEHAGKAGASLSLTAIARRLTAVVGNRSRSAERYLLLACLQCNKRDDEARRMLLDIFREENRAEAFAALALEEDVRHNLQNEKYYLRALCGGDYSAMLEYLNGHFYLLYDAACLNAVRLAVSAAGDAERAMKLSGFTAPPDRDKITGETARKVIEGCMNASDWLEGAQPGDCSEEDLKRIQKALLDADALPMGTDDASIGVRLYRCFGNADRMAERFLWDALSSEDRSVYGGAAAQLTILLNEEARSEECRLVYERYEAECSANEESRRAYLNCLLHDDPAAAMDGIRRNLQDMLTLYAENRGIQAMIAGLCEDADPAVAQFYGKISGLCSHLTDEFPRSVILLGRSLRELLAQPEKLREIGFTEAEEERMKLLRRTNDYPTGMDAVSIAERVYRFMGCRDGVAEAYALFAMPQNEAAELLRRIYLDRNDRQALIRLMKEQAALRDAHWAEYCRILFEENEEMLLKTAFAQRSPETVDQKMMAEILSIRTEGAVTETFEQCVHEMTEADRDLTTELFRALSGRGMVDGLYALAHANIGRMLDEWSLEGILSVLSSRGAVTGEQLEAIQRMALEDGCDQLAVLLWSRMGVGNLKIMADRMYDRMMADAGEMSVGDQMNALGCIQKLFPDRDSQLAVQALVLEIGQLEEKTGAEAVAGMIGEKLSDIQPDEPMLRRLLQAMSAELCAQETVCGHMEGLIKQKELLKTCLERYHCVAQESGEAFENERFAGFMARLYLHALHAQAMPEEMLLGAEGLLCGYVQAYHMESAMLCLVYLERMLGRDDRADYALYSLANAQAEGSEPDEELHALLTGRWTEEIPSALKLFQTALLTCTTEELEGYVRFAGHFVDRDMPVPQFGSGEGDELLSDAECTMLLHSLYADPDRLERWSACADRLPMQGAPAAKARLRLICCQKAGIPESAEAKNEKSGWWKCAELCFAWELDDLLLETLMGWSGQGVEQLDRTRRPAALLRCRDFVEQRVAEDSEFLNRWHEAHAEEMRTLLRRFFRLITDDEATLQKTSIIVTSVLTVALRDRQILTEFIEKKQSILLSDQPDLGFALFCRLMLVERYEEAKLVLDALAMGAGRCTYRLLLNQLMKLDEEGLSAWNGQYGNNSLLRLALPGGSMPPLEVMNDWTMDCIRTFRQEEGLELSSWLCTVFPNNRPFSRMRFYMLKNSGFDRLKDIHRTLYQIISNTPRGETDRYDIRSTQDYACLLAGVNAVLIDSGSTQGIDYYDFSVSAGDFYRSCVMDSSDAVQRINLCQTRFADALQNRPEEIRQKIRRVIVSWVTGDWLGVIHDSWENLTEWAEAWMLQLPTASHGFARSAMRFLLSMEEERRQEAADWLATLTSDDRSMQLTALRLCRRHLDCIADQETTVIRMKEILNYPLEESGMAVQMLNSILTPDLLSDMNAAKRYASAVLALMANQTSVVAANNSAFSAFQAHEDRKASALYYALARCAETLRLTHNPTLTDPTRINSMALRYKRYRYLIILLSDDPQLQSDDLKKDIRGNYFNLTLQLVSSERADEALLLRRRLPADKREIVDTVLYLIGNRSDADKMEYVRNLPDEYIRKGAYFLMSRWGRDLPHSYFVRSQTTVIECDRLYKQMLRVESEFVDWMALRPNALKASRQIQPPQEEEIKEEALQGAAASGEHAEALAEQTEEVLQGINEQMGLTPLTEEEDPEAPEALLAQYENTDSLTQEDRMKRAALSGRMYRMALAGRGRGSRVDGLVRFAVDYFMAGTDSEQERCLLVLQTASVVRYAGEKNRSNFRSMVNRSALLALIRRSHATLRELLGEFYRYRINYSLLMDMISDEEAVRVIHAVYKVLDMLHATYEKLSLSDIEPLKAALTEARTILSRQPYKRNWGDVTGPLMNMILVEFNLLDEQPRLVLRVLNEGACRRIGKIFGQVENIGRSEAKDIQLWISFGNGRVSEPHRLSSLPAGGKAVFDIGYQAERGAQSLSYRVDATCLSRSGSRLQAEAESGEIKITTESLPFFATSDMNTATITVFRPNEQNTDVVSPDFFGRESEKRRLRSLYEDKSFENCRNAVVYGIRRSGKTSLLNYINAYLNHTRSDLVSVVVSGQGASTVYGVFIRDVLSRLKGYVKDDAEMDSYQSLEDRWKRSEDAPDIDPAELMFFYNDVKRYLGGRGLVVIVDEFDRLLEKLDARQDLESSFYPVLSSMLCDAVCAETVHFLFCGSKELIIEKNKDRQITQIFQRMGESDIAIGAMPKQEMISLVTKPFSRYECVKFTEAALEWLWTMAGGLVWFSKLIAKEALTKAGEDERSVVYPSDVFKAACTVAVNDGYCKQFYEGFREDERTLVEAMGNLALRPEQYVTMGQIMELLQSRLTRERAERAMRNLIDLEMVETNRQNASLYRFRVDIYRRYFRAQTEYPRVLPISEGQDVNFQIVLN